MRQDHIGGFEPAQFASEGWVEFLLATVRRFGLGAVAKNCGKSRDTIRRIVNGEQPLAAALSDQLRQFVDDREARKAKEDDLLARVAEAVERSGMRAFSRRTGINAAHLSETLNRRRRLTRSMRQQLIQHARKR